MNWEKISLFIIFRKQGSRIFIRSLAWKWSTVKADFLQWINLRYCLAIDTFVHCMPGSLTPVTLSTLWFTCMLGFFLFFFLLTDHLFHMEISEKLRSFVTWLIALPISYLEAIARYHFSGKYSVIFFSRGYNQLESHYHHHTLIFYSFATLKYSKRRTNILIINYTIKRSSAPQPVIIITYTTLL